MCTTNALALNTVGRRVFEEEGEGAGEFKEMVVELMQVAGEFDVGDFVPVAAVAQPAGVVARMKQLHRWFDAYLDEVISEHRLGQEVWKKGGGRYLLSVMIELKERLDDDDAKGGKITDINEGEVGSGRRSGGRSGGWRRQEVGKSSGRDA